MVTRDKCSRPLSNIGGRELFVYHKEKRRRFKCDQLMNKSKLLRAVLKEDLKLGNVNPRDIKMRLAREITALYHGPEAAVLTEEHFRIVFQRREMPENITEYEIPLSMFDNNGVDAVKLLVSAGFSSSNSEARRLISQGAVKVNGNKIDALKITGLKNGDVVQAGKLKFIKIRIEGC